MGRSKSPSELITERIADLGDWRGETLAHVRKLIKEADPKITEEWKWRGVPVWSDSGIVCTGESYKTHVKLTFQKGFAQGRTGQGHKGPVMAARLLVDGTGHQFLTRAVFAQNQHRRVAGGGPLDEVLDALHDLAVADQQALPQLRLLPELADRQGEQDDRWVEPDQHRERGLPLRRGFAAFPTGVGGIGRPPVSLYSDTFPETTGIPSSSAAWAIPSIAWASSQPISGFSGLPKFRQSVSASGSPPAHATLSADASTAL